MIRQIDLQSLFLDFLHLKVFGLDWRSIEALVLFQSLELIADEREMRVELMICCVLDK